MTPEQLEAVTAWGADMIYCRAADTPFGDMELYGFRPQEVDDGRVPLIVGYVTLKEVCLENNGLRKAEIHTSIFGANGAGRIVERVVETAGGNGRSARDYESRLDRARQSVTRDFQHRLHSWPADELKSMAHDSNTPSRLGFILGIDAQDVESLLMDACRRAE